MGGNYRFIHIDGGHGRDDVFSDHQLAASSTIEEGVIALDDAISVHWPGVFEAICHFLSSDKRFCAIVAGFNKMLIVRRKFAELYTQQIDDQELRIKYKMVYPWHFKKVPFMNHPLRVFVIPQYASRTSLHTKLKGYYQHHNWLKHTLLRPVVLLAKSIVR